MKSPEWSILAPNSTYLAGGAIALSYRATNKKTDKTKIKNAAFVPFHSLSSAFPFLAFLNAAHICVEFDC